MDVIGLDSNFYYLFRLDLIFFYMIGLHTNGSDSIRLDRIGSDWIGSDWIRKDMFRSDRFRFDLNICNRIRFERILPGFNCIGLDSIGSDLFRLDSIGTD